MNQIVGAEAQIINPRAAEAHESLAKRLKAGDESAKKTLARLILLCQHENPEVANRAGEHLEGISAAFKSPIVTMGAGPGGPKTIGNPVAHLIGAVFGTAANLLETVGHVASVPFTAVARMFEKTHPKARPFIFANR